MHILKVGELYNPNVTRWPEMPEYNCRAGQHELLLPFASPSEEEVASVQSGHAHFAFCEESVAIILLYRFEPDVPWGDAAFNIHLVPPDERQLPPLPEATNERALITTLLVDAKTGILRAMRGLTLSPDFTRKLHQAIHRQRAVPFHEATYRAGVQRVYERFQTKDLLKRAVASCRGGA